MEIISATNMAKVDALTIANDCSGEILMERAGQGTAGEILSFLEQLHHNHSRRLVIVCGKGNNAGDGFVIARALADKVKVVIWAVSSMESLKGDALLNAQRLPKNVNVLPEMSFQRGDVIVDCLFGTGLKSAVREPYIKVIERINESNSPVISIDIASGLNGDSGIAQGVAVIADLTIAIGRPKFGHFYEDGPKHTGQLRLVGIGFPQKYFDQIENKEEAIFERDIEGFFTRRPHSVHKYQCGNVVVLGGSPDYLGAPNLAAKMAQRAGAGMVTMIVPTRWNLQLPAGANDIHRPNSSLIINALLSSDGFYQREHWPQILPKIKKNSVLVIGPGFAGVDSEKAFLNEALSYEGKIVIDAGAIALVDLGVLKKRKFPTALTPHTGEFKRLMNQVNYDCPSQFAEESQVHLVLKGQFTKLYFPDGSLVHNSSGSSALATAGSGDVLAGLIGAYVVENNTIDLAVKTAVFVHGRAGEKHWLGKRAMIADDLIHSIPTVVQELTPWA